MDEEKGVQRTKNPLSVLGKVSSSDVKLFPYPHIIIEDALPQEIYENLAANFPQNNKFGSKRQVQLSNRRMNIPASRFLDLQAGFRTREKKKRNLWREFISYHVSESFVSEIIQLFSTGLTHFRPDFIRDIEMRNSSLTNFTSRTRYTSEAEHSDIVLDCQVGINTPAKTKSIVRGPHTDNPNEIWAGLLYFKHKSDNSAESSGALEIWDCKSRCKRVRNEELQRKKKLGMSLIPNHDQFDKQELHRVLSVPYKANTLVSTFCF